jgi:hypothetical protein
MMAQSEIICTTRARLEQRRRTRRALIDAGMEHRPPEFLAWHEGAARGKPATGYATAAKRSGKPVAVLQDFAGSKTSAPHLPEGRSCIGGRSGVQIITRR